MWWKPLADGKQHPNKLSLISPKGQQPTLGPCRGDPNKLVADLDRRKRGRHFNRETAW
jgi:hypothetical protein